MEQLNVGKFADFLGVLSEDLQKFCETMIEVSGEIGFVSGIVLEHGARALRVVRQLKALKDDADHRINRAQEDVGRLMSHVDRSRHEAKAAQQDARKARESTMSTLERWQEELSDATTWVRRAEFRRSAVEQEVSSAEKRLTIARNEEHSAQATVMGLKRGDRENNGVLDSSRVALAELRVTSAKSAVSAAESVLRGARAELWSAKEELSQTRARKAACETAVKVAGRAVAEAERAINQASIALQHTDRANASLIDAQKALDLACDDLDDLNEHVEKTEPERRLLEDGEREVKEYQRKATEDIAEGVHLSRQAVRELDRKVAVLIEFDRPSSLI